MSELLVNAEGGLTTAGYAVTVIAGIVLFLAAVYFAAKTSPRKKMSTKQLVFCAVGLALAYLTSYIKLFEMPWGGSVTLFSMLFIVRILCKKQIRTGQGLHCRSAGTRGIPCSGRISVLDGLYAGQLPESAGRPVSDPLQLQLSACRGRDYCDYYFYSGCIKSAGKGKTDGIGVRSPGVLLQVLRLSACQEPGLMRV